MNQGITIRKPVKPVQHVYLFKARWRATALSFKITAKNEAEAIIRAERQVKKMEGGIFCIDLLLLSQLS